MTADKHPPVLQPRDRFGRDEDWIDYRPPIARWRRSPSGTSAVHAMSHRAGVLGLDAPHAPGGQVRHRQYLFVQAEFGMMCPVCVSDTSDLPASSKYG